MRGGRKADLASGKCPGPKKIKEAQQGSKGQRDEKCCAGLEPAVSHQHIPLNAGSRHRQEIENLPM